MRIAQIDLKAFGHFSDRRLQLGDSPDFHITYGANEAGKTTLSRALKSALFGIPERTTDNFRHANDRLRVGLVLENTKGERFAFMRRKARKNSLSAYDCATGHETGEPISDDCLAAWLGGLTQGLYGSMFGLNHDELVAGGKALSEGKGEVGESLFEAGAGLSTIRSLREHLEKEADRLFRPRAYTTEIPVVLNQYDEARQAIKHNQARQATWTSLRQAVETAKQEYDQARTRQDQWQREIRRLDRLAAVLPDVAALLFTRERLAGLTGIKRLPEDARDQRIAAETALQQAGMAHDEAQANIARLYTEQAGIQLPETLLGEETTLESLYHTLTVYREARDTLVVTRSRITTAQQSLESLLHAIDADMSLPPRTLIPAGPLRARVTNLAAEGVGLRTMSEAAKQQLRDARAELNGVINELQETGLLTLPPALAQVIELAEIEGNPETRADDAVRQAAQLRDSLLTEARSLGELPLETLADLSTPLPAELQHLRDDWEKLESRKKSLRDGIEKNENDLAAVTGELEGLLSQSGIPTAEQLAEQREQRDGLWRSIRSHLYPEPDLNPSPEESLPNRADYENAVRAADWIADTRFTDAARVTQHAELVKRSAQMRRVIELDRQRRIELGQEAVAWEARWQALLVRHTLPTLTLNELPDWLARRDLFLQRYRNWQVLQDQAVLLRQQANELRARLDGGLLAAGLPPCGEDERMVSALSRARDHARCVAEARTRHQVLMDNKVRADSRLQDATAQNSDGQAALTTWQQAWGEAMAAIRLARDARPEEASARLSQFEALENLLNGLELARAERAEAEARVTPVEQETQRLCRVFACDPAGRLPDALIGAWYGQLRDAKDKAHRLQVLRERLEEAVRAKDQAEYAMNQARQVLEALKSAAACNTLAELVEAEQASTLVNQLEQEIIAIEKRLVESAAMPLDELLAQAQGQDLTLVKMDMERVGQDLEQGNALLESLHGKLMEARTAFDGIDGTARAAEAEQLRMQSVARLSQKVVDYTAARLASGILAQVIETYQQQHQGPLLSRASELFQTLTGGRFDKVATDFDDELAILVGVRPDGRRERVGHLSTGTRDQLFLALRLAAIESHLAHQEPMPIVVDDIVINFDDAAADATFRVLADLSAKTQVLFFTHHEHLLEKATQAIGAGGFIAHRL